MALVIKSAHQGIIGHQKDKLDNGLNELGKLAAIAFVLPDIDGAFLLEQNACI